MEVLTAKFCRGPNLEILSARGKGADKNSKFGLGHRAVCHGFLEAHNPKSPKLEKIANIPSQNVFHLRILHFDYHC